MIAREGLVLILIGGVITVGLIASATRYDSRVLFVLGLVFAVLTLFTVFFFRDPDRSFAGDDYVLVAPADGRVLSVDTVGREDFTGGEATKVSIFLSIFDVHINRVPAGGKVDYVKYNPGRFLAAFRDKASHLNEQTEVGMTTGTGHRIVFKQIAGLIARRIVCRLKQGDEVSAGDRFGMIRFGSRAELFVPVGTDIHIKPGEHVKGGRTVVGRLPELGGATKLDSDRKGSNVEI